MTAPSTYRPRAPSTCSAAAIFAPGDAELRSRKKLRGCRPLAHDWAATTVWLAVTAEIASSAERTASRCDSASVTLWTSACARIGTHLRRALFQIERRHLVAAGAQILGQDAPDLAIADQGDVHAPSISRCT